MAVPVSSLPELVRRELQKFGTEMAEKQEFDAAAHFHIFIEPALPTARRRILLDAQIDRPSTKQPQGPAFNQIRGSTDITRNPW